MIPQEMLNHLMRQVEASEASIVLHRIEKNSDEIIFESHIDGIRYCLVRCRPPSNRDISLSPRESAIAQLVAQGLPNKLIGKKLDISPWTVATHLRRIFAKLEVTSRTAMIAKLLEENLL